ncbi:MAG: hypothetical protein KDD14_14910 [Saprospiraceae bacterium]|nr:hypothetical protein [Saprospiraceae bacterium]
MKISKVEHNQLISNGEFTTIGYQYTIMYMARIHSQAEFLFSKVLANRGKLFSDYETSELFEAFSIKTICDWKWYVERMICECLKDDTSKLGEQLDIKLPNSITTDECFGYLNGLGYFDIKSIGNLKSIAKKILKDTKNLFKKISNEAKNKIDDFYSLRNYVAHKSKKSKKTLLELLCYENQLVKQKFHKPAHTPATIL